MSRTQNSALNLITSIFSMLVLTVLNFITRSVFIHQLGTEYLGIEGLFTNILSMLSLTELGFGTTIIFKLYKPIEEGDQHRILVLMKLYRQTYRIVGATILILGLCLIPFLPNLIKDYERFGALNLNAAFIFVIYIINSACSYWFFAYKSALITAHQKSYLVSALTPAINVLSCLTQILVLVLTHNFILYVSVRILFTLLTNLVYAAVCDKKYPYIKESVSDSISKAELKDFFKDCSSLLLYRINDVVISASDNLVLSKCLGLTYIGLYANYLSVKTALQNTLSYFAYSLSASLGSIHATGNVDWSRLLFRVVNFLTVWLYGVFGIGTALLLDEFITLWIGSDYLVTSWSLNGTTILTPLALLIGIELYLAGLQYFCGVFRTSTGLFQKAKFRPVASILVNLAVSILTVPYLGIAGCVVGTITSALTTHLIVEPLILHKYALKCSPVPYFLRNILYAIVILASGFLSWWACGLIALQGILGFIVRGCVCVFIPCAVLVICFHRSTEFRFLMNSILSLINKSMRKTS